MAFRPLVLLSAHFLERTSGRLADDALVYGMTYAQWWTNYELIAQIAVLAQRGLTEWS